MEIRTRDQRGTVDRIYGIIAKTAGKNKFLDFRNNLTLAYLEDYAQLQGSGGSKHAQSSGIKLVIQEYNKDAGVSKNANANIPCHMIDKLLEVCKANIAAPVFESEQRKATEKGICYSDNLNWTGKVYGALATLTRSWMYACAHVVKGNADMKSILREFGTGLKKANEYLTQPSNPCQYPVSGNWMDYFYHQDRVFADHRQKGNQNYLAPVSILEISRKQYKPDGQVSQLPWTISIQNFKATPVWNQNGTTSYRLTPEQRSGRAPKTDESSLYISISDNEMWKCLYKVQHFISVWEMAYGIPLVQTGVAAYEQQQNEFINRINQQNSINQNTTNYNNGYGR